MSFARAFNDQSPESEIAHRKLVERLRACLAELDLIGETVAAAHLCACIETLNSESTEQPDKDIDSRTGA